MNDTTLQASALRGLVRDAIEHPELLGVLADWIAENYPAARDAEAMVRTGSATIPYLLEWVLGEFGVKGDASLALKGLKIFKEGVKRIYQPRKARQVHPSGTFDKQGRWYPDGDERCGCCRSIRSPSSAWPYSCMVHCRTRTHCEVLLSAGIWGEDVAADARGVAETVRKELLELLA
jgi:hypothetical protein